MNYIAEKIKHAPSVFEAERLLQLGITTSGDATPKAIKRWRRLVVKREARLRKNERQAQH